MAMQSFSGTIVSITSCSFWQYHCDKCMFKLEKLHSNINR